MATIVTFLADQILMKNLCASTGVLFSINVVVQEHPNDELEISVVDPDTSIGFGENQ